MSSYLLLAVETHRHKSIGTYLRCASAFGASTVIVVGSPMYSTHGAHGAQNHVQVIHFYYWHECIAYCRSVGCDVYAISPKAVSASAEQASSSSIDTFSFANRSACFIIGEKDGLTQEQRCIVDSVLHVEVPCGQYADLIMYDSKVAICLQQFAVASGMNPRGFEGEKHILGEVNFRRPKTIKAGRDKARQTNELAADPGLSDPLNLLFLD